MEKKDLLYLVIGILIGIVALRAIPMMTGFATVVTTATTGNVAPSVDAVSLNSGTAIDLTAGTTTEIVCGATVSDANGWEDISSVNAVLEYALYNASGDAYDIIDYNYRYILENASSTWYTNDSITSFDVEFTFDVAYQAAPGEWHCILYVLDSTNTSEARNSSTINNLIALDTDEVINFGAVVPETPSSEVSHPVRNWGNVMIDLDLNGTDMTCTVLGTIPYANVKYDVLTSGTAYGSMIALAATPAENILFNLAKKTINDTETNATKDTYWMVMAPSGAKGECNGTAQFTAVIGDVDVDSAVDLDSIVSGGVGNATALFFSQKTDNEMVYVLWNYYENETSYGLDFYNTTLPEGNWGDGTYVEADHNTIIETNSPVIFLADGNLAVVYSDDDGNDYEVYIAISDDDGATWTPTAITDANTTNDTRPSAAVDSNGVIHVVFNNNKPPGAKTLPTSTDYVYYSNSTDNGTTWSTKTQISSGYSSNPTIVIDENDDIHVIFAQAGLGEDSTVLKYINSTNGGESWNSETYITNDFYYNQDFPTALIDLDSHIWVFYELRYPTNTEADSLIAATRSYDYGATWDASRRLSSDNETIEMNPSAGILPYGDEYGADFGRMYVHFMNSTGWNRQIQINYNVSEGQGLPVVNTWQWMQ